MTVKQNNSPMTDSNISIVIPSANEHVRTTDSVPDGVPYSVEREGTLNEARNRGVRQAETDLVAIMDDDISFPEGTLDELAHRARPDTLLGIADWDYGWVAGRVMVFHRDLWEDVGGFDERLRSHMADTEFALSALRNGCDLERIPREVFYHDPHDRSIGAWDHAWRGLYLAAKHPRFAPRLAKGLIA